MALWERREGRATSKASTGSIEACRRDRGGGIGAVGEGGGGGIGAVGTPERMAMVRLVKLGEGGIGRGIGGGTGRDIGSVRCGVIGAVGGGGII